MHNIINGSYIPAGSELRNDGSVIAVDQTGAIYEVGRITMRGVDRVFNKAASPKFLGQANQPAQPGYGQPIAPQGYPAPQAGYPQMQVTHPAMGANTRTNNPISVAGSTRTTRRSTRASTTQTGVEEPSDYPVISKDAVLGFTRGKKPYTLDEVMTNLSHFANSIVDIQQPSEVVMSKKFYDNVLLSESTLYVSESAALDAWLLKALNTIGEPKGVVMGRADDLVELKTVAKDNELVKEVWDKFIGSIKVTEDSVKLFDMYVMAFASSEGCTSELHSIRGIGPIELPEKSFVSRLVAEENPSKICTGEYIFDILNGKYVRVRQYIGDVQ